MNGRNVTTAPEDGPDLHELGIAGSDEDLAAVAGTEPAIVAEAEALRTKAKSPLPRQRAGPLPPETRGIIVGESIAQLRRALLGLVLATETLAEVQIALAFVGLEVRRFPTGLDALAAALKRDL